MAIKIEFSKKIVSIIVGMNIAFTAAVLIIFLMTSSEPGVLVGCWFGFTTGELWALATIKKTKIKKKEECEDSEILQSE